MLVAWLVGGGGGVGVGVGGWFPNVGLQPSASARERLSGDEETRPVAARQYKYGMVGGGGEGAGPQLSSSR